MMHHLTFYYFPHIFFKNSVLPCFTGKKVLPVVIPVNHWFGKTSKTTTLVTISDYSFTKIPLCFLSLNFLPGIGRSRGLSTLRCRRTSCRWPPAPPSAPPPSSRRTDPAACTPRDTGKSCTIRSLNNMGQF